MGFGVGLDEGNFLIPKQSGRVGVLCVVMMISGSEQRLIPNTRVLCTAPWARFQCCFTVCCSGLWVWFFEG